MGVSPVTAALSPILHTINAPSQLVHPELFAEISGMVRGYARCTLLHGSTEIGRQGRFGERVLLHQHVNGFSICQHTVVAGNAEFGGQGE
jgi:hypothetical protein